MRHQCRQPIVVAEPDLVGGHCVVLVDDGQHPEVQQSSQRALGVAVVGAADQILGGEQHLPDADVVLAELRGVVGDEDSLPDARGCLLGRQITGRLAQP